MLTLPFAIPNVAPAFLWIIFGVLIIISFASSAVLIYHWNRFGHGPAIITARIVYSVGLAGLLIALFFTLISLLASL